MDEDDGGEDRDDTAPWPIFSDFLILSSGLYQWLHTGFRLIFTSPSAFTRTYGVVQASTYFVGIGVLVLLDTGSPYENLHA